MALKRETWGRVLERKLAGYFIFLDIDGTLLPDGDEVVPKEMKQAVRTLTEKNTVVILSNSRRPERAQKIAEQVALPLVKTRHRKPNRRILKDVPAAKHPMLVIGDKITTDALFARAIKAKCILVEQKRGRSDRGWVNASYTFDDMVGVVLDFFSIFENIAP